VNLDFRIECSLFTHPKFVRLSRRLGAEGALAWIRLLGFAAQNRPSGNFGEVDNEYVAIAADYHGDADDFVSTLVTVKFLDREPDGTLSIHEWSVHQPWASEAQARSNKATKAAKARWEKKYEEQPSGDAPHDSSIAPHESSNAKPDLSIAQSVVSIAPHESSNAPIVPAVRSVSVESSKTVPAAPFKQIVPARAGTMLLNGNGCCSDFDSLETKNEDENGIGPMTDLDALHESIRFASKTGTSKDIRHAAERLSSVLRDSAEDGSIGFYCKILKDASETGRMNSVFDIAKECRESIATKPAALFNAKMAEVGIR
jgi:hypothetical protein